MSRDLDERDAQAMPSPLRESHQLLRRAVEVAGIGLLTLDFAAHTAIANETAAEIWGLTSLQPFPLRTLHDLFHPDDRTEIEQRIEQSLDIRGSGSFDMEFRIVRSTGSVRWLKAGQQVCFDDRGPRTGVMVTVDLTNQKLAEMAVARSEAESRTHFEMAGIANAEIRFDTGNIVRVNRRFCSLMGYTVEELLDRKLVSLILSEDREHTFPEVDEILPTGKEQHEAEKRFVRNDGSVCWVHLTSTLIRSEAGSPSTILINAQDVNGRKEIEGRIQESESRFRRFMENSPAYAFMKDAEGRYVYVNPQCAKLIPLDEWIGKTDLDLFPISTANEFRENDRNVLNTGQPEQALETMETENGPIYFLAIKFPLQNLKGQVLLAGISVDVTAKYRAEQELRDADKRKNHFLASLAHELRNPLAPIRNAVQILQMKASPDPELIWVKEMLDRQVGQMSRLLDDLIDLSRISRNRLELRKSRIELSKILEIAVETSRPLIDAEGHQFTMNRPNEEIYLEGDYVRLSQVFSNLLNNAAKYTPGGGRIHLGVVQEPHEIVVCVEDSGIGIPAEKLPEIFEIFWQGTLPDTTHRGGLGIGLSIVRGLVELHNGRVEASSAGIGKGSQFRVRLPYLSVPSPSPVQQEATNHVALSHINRTVLVVDDNRDSADSMSMQLRLKGHQTLVANDGEQALEILQSIHPDVILLDIGLPGISGHDVAHRIRQLTWGNKVLLIAMTGWGQRADRIRSQQAGFDHHLTKPVDLNQLDQILASDGSK